MRNFVLALVVLSASAACAPQASGPPQTGGEATSTTTSVAVTTPAAGPETGAPPASPGVLPSGHPAMSGGASPPPGHLAAGGGMTVTDTEGAIVQVKGDELILARPTGTELKFYIPKDMKVLPEGKTQADLKMGTRVKIHIHHVERGMEAQSVTVENLPPAHP